MSAFTRRTFLSGAAGSAAGLAVGCRQGFSPGAAPADDVFRHGVASGDPQTDRVILWTRVTVPETTASVEVEWQVFADEGLREEVATGRVYTTAGRDFTVKVDATLPEAGRTWYYRFRCLGNESPIGRTKTLPTGEIDRVRLALASCSNFPQGFFNAYARIAERDDLDAVLHLGDYIYEYANEGGYGEGKELGRHVAPAHEILTLEDYRLRYATYRSDPDLQAVHRMHPFIVVWDDHESTNNSWRFGAQNHQPGEGEWAVRKRAAMRAYHEWMPIRDAMKLKLVRHEKIWRSFRFGNLADLFMLDTRLVGRHEQAARDDFATIQDPTRELLGVEQEAWLVEGLVRSRNEGTAWRLLGQQVIMSPLSPQGSPGNPDAWDGYPVARERLIQTLSDFGVGDLVVLAGDVHSSWGLDLAPRVFEEGGYDPATGRGSRAVEIVTPAISSSPLGSFEQAREAYSRVSETHPHLHFHDMDHRGYTIVDLTAERARAEWWFVDTVAQPSPGERLGGALEAKRGTNHLVSAT